MLLDTDTHVQPRSQARVNLLGAMIVALTCTSLYAIGLFAHSSLQNGIRYFYSMDDVFISMRFAANFANGLGLVWNEGEFVQGYSNLGWTLYLAIFEWLKVEKSLTPAIPIITNYVLHLLISLTVFVILKRYLPTLFATIYAVCVIICHGLFMSGMWGFETIAQSLCFLLCGLPLFLENTSVRRAAKALIPIATVVAIVLRLDSLAFFFGFFACLAFKGKTDRDLRALAISVATFGTLAFVGVVVWQHWYYGDWLPNTYYLKASDDSRDLLRGMRSYLNFVCFQGGAIPVVTIVFSLYVDKNLWKKHFPTFLPILSVAMYDVWTGGDYFHFERFAAMAAPYDILWAGRMFADCLRSDSFQDASNQNPISLTDLYRFAPVPALLFVFALVSQSQRIYTDVSHSDRHFYDSVIETGLKLNSMTDIKGGPVAVFTAGILPYYNLHLTFHDMLGKVDRHVARLPARKGLEPGHNKYDFDYSLNADKAKYLLLIDFSDLSVEKVQESLNKKMKTVHGFGYEIFLSTAFKTNFCCNKRLLGSSEFGTFSVFERAAISF